MDRALSKPLDAIHSTKIQTGPTGKRGPPQKVDLFFETFPVGPNRSIEFWTEISGNFGEWIVPQLVHRENRSRHANYHAGYLRGETGEARKKRDFLFSSRAAALVSRVFAGQRSRARALPSLKRPCRGMPGVPGWGEGVGSMSPV